MERKNRLTLFSRDFFARLFLVSLKDWLTTFAALDRRKSVVLWPLFDCIICFRFLSRLGG